MVIRYGIGDRMPGRETHAAATLVLTAAVAAAGIAEPRAFLVAAGALAGLAIHPDLDSGGAPYWRIYATTHKHRGLSHWPVVGTMERAAWLLAPPVLAAMAADYEIPWLAFSYWLAGLVLADGLHILMDRFWRP